MEKNLLEKIKVNVEEMKKFRPTLRSQVEELLNSVAGEVIEAGGSFYIEVGEREFFIGEYQINHENRRVYTDNEFVEACGGKCEPIYNKGFNGGSYVGGFAYEESFDNDDIIFLAQHIEEILEKINSQLDASNKILKPLTIKLDKILDEISKGEI
ncbi:hypothetical protein RBU49_02955 [Clostridium sp. MB40-C1]|uniref:hypothetical protein n=1 Tax=Clostridium sp. MB40-C1 TaxID=3070996 RepID=UPI0027DFC64B|nr:hypothetical protein [Clostridium sp. MB40-C1]WMJ81229.1 hypothetical protein RBU49_02955 [Clostridium sp. MB40-C1]